MGTFSWPLTDCSRDFGDPIDAGPSTPTPPPTVDDPAEDDRNDPCATYGECVDDDRGYAGGAEPPFDPHAWDGTCLVGGSGLYGEPACASQFFYTGDREVDPFWQGFFDSIGLGAVIGGVVAATCIIATAGVCAAAVVVVAGAGVVSTAAFVGDHVIDGQPVTQYEWGSLAGSAVVLVVAGGAGYGAARGGWARGLPDSMIVVRGGQQPVPPPGVVFSGAYGRTLLEAGSHTPYGSIRVTTAGEIRASGGTVTIVPELTRAGVMNPNHVSICLGAGQCPFGSLLQNPVPKAGRIQ